MEGKTIMIADDDQDILNLVAALLIDSGYRVVTSYNGDGLESLDETGLPDLLLLDIRMRHGRNGKEIAARLKRQKATQNLPIVLISANHDIVEAVEESGADGFVQKPFNVKQLMEVVRQYVG